MSLLYAGQSAQQGNSFVGLIPLFLIIIIFYFLLIRPQQKKMKEHQKMLTELKKGDKIITESGIYGVVESLKEDRTGVYILISENVKVLFTINSIAKIIK